jgi:hypothetical protein
MRDAVAAAVVERSFNLCRVGSSNAVNYHHISTILDSHMMVLAILFDSIIEDHEHDD